jgi:hypothetical protein
MIKKFCGLIILILIVHGASAGQNDPGDSLMSNGQPHAVIVTSYIHHISDINIRDEQYKIEIWLFLRSRDSLWGWDSLANQIQINGAKELSVSVIPQFQKSGTSKVYDSTLKYSVYRKIIKINCTMSQDWDVDNYPFDNQPLKIICYTIRPLKWLLLVPDKRMIAYRSSTGDNLGRNIENGWAIVGDSVLVTPVCQRDIFDTDKKYSGIQFSLQISRKQIGALFFKLFIGMYVSFFVAFIAFFIHVTHVEPRFGLPVGGLFAAIGNKYIMEGVLPQSSEFTIVDTLHTCTILAILMVIIFSAISLKLVPSHEPRKYLSGSRFPLDIHQMRWIDRNGAKLILIVYTLFNILSVVWGCIHERGWI